MAARKPLVVNSGGQEQLQSGDSLSVATLNNGGDLAVPTSADTLVARATTDTLTNKRIQKRVVSVSFNAAPTYNVDNGDIFEIASVTAALTNMSTNMSGTPVEGEMIEWVLKDDGTARAITWGSEYAASGNVALPTTTVISTVLRVLFQRQTSAIWGGSNVWVCIAVA